jgi:hypothetical protein
VIGAGLTRVATLTSDEAHSIFTCVRPAAALSFTRSKLALPLSGSSDTLVVMSKSTTPPRVYVGEEVGSIVGATLGAFVVGALLGADVEGAVVGSLLKLFGAFVGAEVGTCDGAVVGCEVGLGAMWHSVPSHTFPFKDPGLPVHSVATMGHA